MDELNLDELNLDDIGDINLDNIETNKQSAEKVEAEVIADESSENHNLDADVDLDTFLNKEMKKVENNKKASKSKSEVKKEEKKSVYTGPRIVKVYGDELWVENDPNVTNEQIRERIVNEFGYGEFTKGKTLFDLDTNTGILDIGKQFQKKG